MMINRLKNNIKIQYIIVFLLGITLSIIYGSKIHNVTTVWELGDEAGYLCNAAYMAGLDWSSVSSILPYYGYGYSIILIPVFLVARTGIELIQGAIFINVICVVITYLLEVYVSSKLLKKTNIVVLAIFCFISVITPYMATNTFKVLCEVFLTMWLWVIASFLILTYKIHKWWTYIILGVATAYIFFIHTRAIIVIVSMIVTVSIMLYKRMISRKDFILFLLSIVICFGILYIFKKNIIVHSMQLRENDARTDVNMVNSNYIVARIKWLIKDYPLYIIGFSGKILYLITSTGCIFLYGITEIYKKVKEYWSKQDCLELVLYLFFGCTFVFMLIACVLNGAGTENNFTYIFYSRYYEYTLPAILIIGLYNIVYCKENCIINSIYVLITVSLGMVTSMARTYLLNSDEVHVDTARIPGFTYLIMQDTSFKVFIYHITIFCVVLLVLIAIVKIYLKNKCQWVLIIGILILLSINSKDCINKVFQASIDAEEDVELAMYIIDTYADDEIPFINSDYKWPAFFSRMQVLLKDKKLVILQEDEMNDEKYFVTYLFSELGSKLEVDGKLIKRGAVFGLYYME